MFSGAGERAFRLSRLQTPLLILILFLGAARGAPAYSVLSHEAIIDSVWDDGIQPLLLKRFPGATPEDLKKARAYAYGGAIIQDLGFYPFGSKFFSHLVHYVRNGDFIEALLREAQDVNEYAFALGALSHYAADNGGHRLAVNRAVPILYPKLQRKFGSSVTYAQDPAAHLKTEFGFDVLQVARASYVSEDYHDRIGFQVAKPVLERAFQDTYCLDLKSVFSDFDLAVGSYRHSVGEVIPKMTEVAWELKKDEIRKDFPAMTRKKYAYRLTRAEYEKQWDKNFERPGFGTKFLALVIRLIPKIGPFKALSFRTPTPETEKMFLASFDATLKEYSEMLDEERKTGRIEVANDNLDTGNVTAPGQYSLADRAYAELLDRLAKDHFQGVTPQLRSVILAYYSNLHAPFYTKRKKNQWAELLHELGELKAFTPAPADRRSD